MVSAKLLGLLDLSPYLHLATDLYYRIQATSLTAYAFGGPPSPLSADII